MNQSMFPQSGVKKSLKIKTNKISLNCLVLSLYHIQYVTHKNVAFSAVRKHCNKKRDKNS